jgi:predicted amidophosphoribosyltransferase
MQKLTKCPVCGENIARNANVCPHCGANLVFRKPGVWIGLILFVAALFCMFKACSILGTPASTTPAQTAIVEVQN